MKLWHVSSGMVGASSMSTDDVKSIICLIDGWNLKKQSFFLFSFSHWNVRVFLLVVAITSNASAWWAMDVPKKLKTSGGIPVGTAPGTMAGGKPATLAFVVGKANRMPCALLREKLV
jgi:hypothetical protein